jgi:hypothetical protein
MDVDGDEDGSQGGSVHVSGDVVEEEEKQVEERPKKMGRPLGRDDSTIPTPSPLPYMFPVRERHSTFPSSLINRSSSRPPHASTSKPQLHRSQTDDLDLLRQVKSNNLVIPSTITSTSSSHIPPYIPTAKRAVQPHLYQHQPQHRHQHEHQSSTAQAPYPHFPTTPAPTAPQQHRHQHYEPPFIHAPLYHPPSTSNYSYRPNQAQKVKSRPIEQPPDSSSNRKHVHREREHHRGQAPVNTHLLQSNTAVPPQSPNSSSNATSPSAPSVETSTPDDSETGSAEIPLPPGDWRWAYIRRYGGRGRGQSGG